MKKKSASASAGRRRLLQGAALIGAAAVVPSLAANAQNQPKVTLMSADTASKPTREMTADEIRKLLQLEPNATCGFVRVTFESKLSIAADGLPAPFGDKRPLGSALYFLVTPGAPVRLHRIRNDQLYHYYLGDPLELFMLHADGSTERVVVGPDIRDGQNVQLLIPGIPFAPHGCSVRAAGFWARVAGVVVEIGKLDELAGKYSKVAADLRAIAASVQHVG
jgi:uncharacterized protein